MKKFLGYALLLMLAGVVYVAADTTFSWSGPQATGTLQYNGLSLTNTTISGAVILTSPASVSVMTNGTLKVTGAANVVGVFSVTNVVFSNLPTDTNNLAAGRLWSSNGVLVIKQ